MDIETTVHACNAAIIFSDPFTAVIFLKMLVHQIQPEQYMAWIKATSITPGDLEDARDLVNRCVGMPS